MIVQGGGEEWVLVRPMRPSHHDDGSILRMQVCQVRELKVGAFDSAATCTVKEVCPILVLNCATGWGF
jgi:hypothetical protein